MAITKIDPSFNIKKYMDRRLTVFEAILKAMDEFWGDVSTKLFQQILKKLEEDDNKLETKQPVDYPFVDGVGFYCKLYHDPEHEGQYTAEPPEHDAVVVALQHLDGQIVLAS
eukprot:8612472-Lingulodinium_polyedra.AAC.1